MQVFPFVIYMDMDTQYTIKMEHLTENIYSVLPPQTGCARYLG